MSLADLPSKEISSVYLRACGAAWLRYDLQCPIVTFERGLQKYHGYHAAPDLFAINKKRQPMEIEIKISMSDFKANFEKRIIFMQKKGFVRKPFEFNFLVPPHLADKVAESPLLTWEGVLTLSDDINAYTGLPGIRTVRPCKVNKKAPKLQMPEVFRMIKNQSGSLVTALVKEAFHVHSVVDPRTYTI